MEVKRVAFGAWRFSLAVCMFATMAGCSTTAFAPVRTTSPARYSFGSSRVFVIAQGTGPRSSREAMTAALAAALRTTGWWNLQDRSEQGIQITATGDTATIVPTMPAVGEVFAKIDLYEGGADRDEVEHVEPGPNNTQQVVRVPVYRGRIHFGVTLVNSTGRALLSETEFSGESEVPVEQGRDGAISAAMYNAVNSFVGAVTPTFGTELVQLDNEAEDLSVPMQMVEQGAFAAAAERLRQMLAAQPTRADIAFDLAVVAEAMGETDKACPLYEQALRLGRKPFYDEAQAGCARRLQGQRALE